MKVARIKLKDGREVKIDGYVGISEEKETTSIMYDDCGQLKTVEFLTESIKDVKVRSSLNEG